MTQPVSRKWWLALSIAAALASAPAFAAKDVVVAVGSNFTTLDPYDANDTLSQAVAKSFYQGLFGLDKEMKLQNVLAESYTVSPDGLVYTIKLHSGVKFQDGTDFNAEAVKANLDRASNPDNHLKRYNLYKNIASTEAVDPTTVKITLKQPFSAFINILAHPATAMISPAALKKYGKDIGFHPVGTGPYKLDTWNQTDFVKVSKFDGYWQPGLPKLDSITWRPVVDNNTRAAMLQTGEAQFAFPIPYEQAPLLAKNSKLELVASPSIMQRYISMNVTQKPFDNPKVREAINSTGEADWALSPLFASQNWPPTLFNTAFYSNPQVDNALSEALKTTDPQQKTKLYKEAQDIIWKESPWVPLVVEKLVSAHSKNLTGFYIQPDTGFSFEQADLTP
ncbi:glutathione ABC transporter substrate-binding protein GsiB [Klebsiella pneumoniae]